MEESKSCSEWASKRSNETAEALRKLRVQADESLNARRRHLSDLETELNHRIQQVASGLAHELVETRDLEETNSHEDLLAQVDLLTDQIERESYHQDQLKLELTGLKQASIGFEQEQAKFQEEHQAQSEHLQQQQQQLSKQSDELQELAQQREQATVQVEELIAQREQASQALSDLQAQPCAECESLQQRVAQLEQVECEKTQRLAEQENEQVRLQETVQEIRAEAEQQAQQHTEAEAKVSLELEHLVAERDALVVQVGELEDAAPAATKAGHEEEMADLLQRFELAIEDVRNLKQENSQLQTQLQTQQDALQTDQSVATDDGPLDWQAQKAMMLASLAEEEGGPITEQRQQDRTTIQDTLSVTDQVVAEKDQVIVELREQMTTLQSDLLQKGQTSEESPKSEHQAEQASRDALLSDDELIQQERNRLEQLQQGWEDKLRQAELTISVERATLAREQAALEEKMAAVKEQSSEDQDGNDQRPRRRWMAALGIKSGEQDE
ncbi:MAG: hypothetical protein ABGX16_16260 [Pirellulales bacterium]